MRKHSERYSVPFILVHWLLAFLILLLLGLGAYIESLPPQDPGRVYFLEVHISLGLSSLVLILLQITLRFVSRPPPFPTPYPNWLAHLSLACYLVIYLCMLLMPLSGYLQAEFAGTPLKIWGLKIPSWATQNAGLVEFFSALHTISAYLLGGFVLIHIVLVVLGTLNGYGIAGRMLPVGLPSPREVTVETPPGITKIARNLARNILLLGWVKFWLQLGLALVSGLLLMFATSGRTFSPSTTGLGDGMFWATWAFMIVCVTILIAFYYTRAARRIALSPDAYINPERKIAFWFLGLGLFAGTLGLLASLSGVAASISLLIAKTVSQPPGIAITDPNKIIRALDVFILLVNFSLLMAHFIGTGASVWLSIKVANSRIAYHNIAARIASKERSTQALSQTDQVSKSVS